MTTGEKIKYFRNMRGVSQETLGQLSGINSATLLFKMDDQIDMKFEADKDDEGNFKPATVKLSFKNNLINKKLCTYMKALEIRENMLNAKDEYSEEEYADSLQHINENIEEISQISETS